MHKLDTCYWRGWLHDGLRHSISCDRTRTGTALHTPTLGPCSTSCRCRKPCPCLLYVSCVRPLACDMRSNITNEQYRLVSQWLPP